MRKMIALFAILGLAWSTPALAQEDGNTDTTFTEDTITTTTDDTEEAPGTANSENVGEVTASNQDDMKTRQESEAFSFFRFGPASLFNMEAEGAGIYLSGGRLYATHPKAAIRVAGEAIFSNGETGGTASYFAASLGGVYYIDETDTAPHAFADLGYGYADGPDVDSTNGFTLGAGIGTAFFRTTDMQMDASIRYQILLNPNDEGAPSLLALMLGLNFG